MFRDDWIEENVSRLQTVYPDADKDALTKFVSDKYDEYFKDNKCTLYNNYEKQTVNTTLYKLLNWIDDKKPITTESGSLFKQHEEAFNPDAYILGQLLDKRAIAKTKMLNYAKDADSEKDPVKKKELTELSNAFDMVQRRKKVQANSEYGVSGLASSQFFSMCTASATTARGQALISTAETSFEDFLGDNVKFHDTDECIRFIEYTVSEKPNWKYKVSDWVNRKTVEETLKRLVDKFADKDAANEKIIKRYLNSLSSGKLTRVYYKSNMDEFFRNSSRASNIIRKIVLSSSDYLDPTNPPDDFKDDLILLRDVVLEFVHFCHPVMDRVNRLKLETRKRVLVIDTDSCFINYGPWVDFIQNEIMKPITRIHRSPEPGLVVIEARNWEKGKEYDKIQKERFRIIYTMVFFITEMIARTLKEFMRKCNLKDMSKNYAKMKNEFLYDNILLTDAKKHYVGTIRVREGKMFETAKKDIKGLEYRKPSMASKDTRDFIDKIVFKDILGAKDSKPDIAKILRKVQKFEFSIKDAIYHNDFSYFKTANVKTADAYDAPYSIGNYKAVFIWNWLNPDKKIDLPGVAYIAKIKISGQKDIAYLATEAPDIYKRMCDLLDYEIEVVDRKNKITKVKKFGDSDITSIALPLDCEIPEWLKPLIDVTQIIQSNTKLLTPILESLGIKPVYKRKQMEFISGIIQL